MSPTAPAFGIVSRDTVDVELLLFSCGRGDTFCGGYCIGVGVCLANKRAGWSPPHSRLPGGVLGLTFPLSRGRSTVVGILHIGF